MPSNASSNGYNYFDVDIFMENLNRVRIVEEERSRHSRDNLYLEKLHRIHVPGAKAAEDRKLAARIEQMAEETLRQLQEHELHSKMDDWSGL
jgi:hypothetical protein